MHAIFLKLQAILLVILSTDVASGRAVYRGKSFTLRLSQEPFPGIGRYP